MGKKKNKIRKKKAKKNSPLRAIGILLGLLALMGLILMPKANPEEWKVSPDGLLEYPAKRSRIDCQRTPLEDGDDYTLDKVIFESKGLTVYGLLRIPKGVKNPPGMVLLPGAQVTKEGQQALAKSMQKLGYASLSLDQRGHGETGGYVASMEEDFRSFIGDVEPVQHKMVYDALRAVDCMGTFDELDHKRIYIGGESMGGRFAIIAGGIDKSIAGVLAISTSGYRLPSGLPSDQLRFFTSIDPNSYISKISPRKLVMIHSKNDSVVPIDDARITFEKAHEPKAFYTIKVGTHHGYHPDMDEYIKTEFG
ncbi:MAG: alpha/beta hydrolase [Candidatus Hydrothermarchaeales archaeon]